MVQHQATYTVSSITSITLWGSVPAKKIVLVDTTATSGYGEITLVHTNPAEWAKFAVGQVRTVTI